jgi:hypothetical protein
MASPSSGKQQRKASDLLRRISTVPDKLRSSISRHSHSSTSPGIRRNSAAHPHAGTRHDQPPSRHVRPYAWLPAWLKPLKFRQAPHPCQHTVSPGTQAVPGSSVLGQANGDPTVTQATGADHPTLNQRGTTFVTPAPPSLPRQCPASTRRTVSQECCATSRFAHPSFFTRLTLAGSSQGAMRAVPTA